MTLHVLSTISVPESEYAKLASSDNYEISHVQEPLTLDAGTSFEQYFESASRVKDTKNTNTSLLSS